MADLNYVAEKFHTAVAELVLNLPPAARLDRAFMSFHPVSVDDFKDEPQLQAAYKQIRDRLRSPIPQMSELGGAGDYRANRRFHV